MGRMKLHRPRSPTLAAVLAGVARLAALTAAVADSSLEGLASPRGLTALDDGRLLIAEVGGGRLLILDRQNRLLVLHGGLPRLKDGPEGVPAGVSAAVQLGGITYYVVGEARAKEFPEVYALAPGDHPVGLTDQDPLGLAPLNPITNPYDLLPAPSGGLLVSDAGANAVWRFTLAGEIHPYARLDPQTHATADGSSAQVEGRAHRHCCGTGEQREVQVVRGGVGLHPLEWSRESNNSAEWVPGGWVNHPPRSKLEDA